jgi:hypothetical protein
VEDLLRRSEILLLPGNDAFFQQTTQAAFNEDDLNAIAGGNPLSKVILVADYNEAKWKLDRVNELYGDLMRCKNMMREEVDRLDRRKGLFLLTDHLQPFKQDQKFLHNEARLQTLLGAIERLDGHMNDLRQRRLALAFLCELIAQDQTFNALNQEQSELEREKTVLEVDRQRLDAIFNEVAPENPRRVTIERSRQRNIAALAAVDSMLQHLQSARGTMAEMSGTSRVIHRQGDTRLLAATMVVQQLPLAVREAVERESLMSIRLERGRNVFVPVGGEGSSAFAAPTSFYERQSVATYEQASQQPPESAKQSWTQGEGQDDQHPGFGEQPLDQTESQAFLAGQKQGEATSPATKVQPTSTTQAKPKTGCNLPLILKLLVPPCWFMDDLYTGSAEKSSPSSKHARLASQREGETPTEQKSGKGCDCPWIIKLLVPPCWFLGDVNN